MPLKLEKRCKVCQLIHEGEDAVLLKRIYRSRVYRTGGEPLQAIHADYVGKFTYSSLTVHTKLHQAITDKDLKKETLDKLNKNEANKAIKAVIKHGDVRNLIMEKGYKGIKSGKIKLKAADVRAAAKDQADFEIKSKDQGLQVMDMMMRFMSGETKAPIGATNADNGIDGPGPSRSLIDITP